MIFFRKVAHPFSIYLVKIHILQ